MSTEINPDDVDIEGIVHDSVLAQRLVEWARPMFPAGNGKRLVDVYQEDARTIRVGVFLDGKRLDGRQAVALYDVFFEQGYVAVSPSNGIIPRADFTPSVFGSVGNVIRFYKHAKAA